MSRAVIGAGRLLLPNPELAMANGWQHGLPIEEKLQIDLASVAPPGAIGEVGRFCVAEPWRGSTALLELCAAMGAESLRNGVTYWLSAANMDCDSEEEAHVIHALLDRRGLVRRDIGVTVRARERPPSPPRFLFFKGEEERRRAINGDPQARLPRAVSADAALGAKFIGGPLWDAYFGMFAVPLIASVEDVLRTVERLRRASRRRAINELKRTQKEATHE